MGGEPPIIFGDGEQSRDFTYVDNVIQANVQAAVAEGVAGRVYNVACGERFTLNALVAQIAEIVGSDVEPEHAPARVGDVRHSMACIERARADLGYEPEVSFADGLAQTAEFLGGAASGADRLLGAA